MGPIGTEAGSSHGQWKTLTIGFDEAVARLPEALKREGFGVITQIDIKATFKAKLDVDFRRYQIFGACNPSFAHKALQEDPRVGVLLPCNVVVYENDDGKAVVGAIDPMQTLAANGASSSLAALAGDVGARLARVLAGLPS